MSTSTPGTGTALPQSLSPDAFSSMFQSIAGLRNQRAAVAMLSCFFVGVLLAGLLGVLGRGSFAMMALAGLVAALFFFTGIHAAGVLLMDQARQLPLRSVIDAVVYGLICVPKTIALIVLMALAVIGLYVVMWVLFMICKVPGLGPALFVFVFPACVLLAGVATVGLTIALQMVLPALWEGAGVASALAKAYTILRSRLVETIMLLAVVIVLSGFVFAIVGAVLLLGFFPATGLAAAAIGSFGSMGGGGMYGGGGMLGSTLGGLMDGATGIYAMSGTFGSGLLWAVALTLVFQVALLGSNLAYLRVSEGLDSSATERAMNERLDQARRKAAEMGQQAKDAAERARAQAEQAAAARRGVQSNTAAVVALPASASTCPQCSAAVTPADLFCGTCGHKLK